MVLGAPYEDLDPCDAAEEIVDDSYLELGMPMRTTNIARNVTHEIRSIRKVRSFPAGTFNFPTGYPQMTREELFQENIETVPSHQGQSITMEELIQMQDMIEKQVNDLHDRRQAHPFTDMLRKQEKMKMEEAAAAAEEKRKKEEKKARRMKQRAEKEAATAEESQDNDATSE